MGKTMKEWVLATRPWSFPASAMPVLVTLFALWADGRQMNWWLGLLAVVNIVLVHGAGNVWSDWFDFKKGVDRDDTYGTKNLTSGHYSPSEVMRLSIVLHVAAVVMGIGMVVLTGWPLLWIGMAGIGLSLLYPPLKYSALGDVVILCCYALLPMMGTSFIATGSLVWPVLWYAPPVGLITVAILHSNNTRDIHTDRRAGIKTFSMLTGWRIASGIYIFEVLFPYVWMLAGVGMGLFAWPTLACLISLPIAWRNAREMAKFKGDNVEVIACTDEKTAQLQLAFSSLLILGLLAVALFL